jgi:hypothetical protein
MNISYRRLEMSLATSGFLPVGHAKGVPSYRFVRPDENADLYQQLDVEFAGRKSEAAYAEIALSATRFFQIKGLAETRLLGEIASVAERGWTIVSTSAQAKAWERSFCQVAPESVKDFAGLVRESLLKRTEEARQQSRLVLKTLDPRKSVTDQLAVWEQDVSPSVFVEAERQASSIGVILKNDAKDVYLLSCLAVLRGSGGGRFVGQTPIMNDGLFWRIQLVADGIMAMCRGESHWGS